MNNLNIEFVAANDNAPYTGPLSHEAFVRIMPIAPPAWHLRNVAIGRPSIWSREWQLAEEERLFIQGFRRTTGARHFTCGIRRDALVELIRSAR